jgi:hypothetical protein
VRLIRQRGERDCGVAVFAMLTDREYEAAAATLGIATEVPDHAIKVLLQRDGWFIREIWRREDTGGVWPPPPFAERHFAIVTQPSGNGHYLAMEADGTVLDPLEDGPRVLEEWDICAYVCGMARGL